MLIKLAEVETNFYRSFILDRHYDDILDMLKNIDMLSDTNTDTNLTGTNKGTITGTRTDNLKTTKSSRLDTTQSTTNNTENRGAREDVRDTVNGGNITKDTEYGRTSTDTGDSKEHTDDSTTSNSRSVVSQFPQSIIGNQTSGIDAPLNWNYATGAQDGKATNTGVNDKTTNTNNTNKLGGTDKEVTKDARTVVETLDTGEQTITNNGTGNGTFNEGEQSVSNTGTQDNSQTENREHSQVGKYKKVNDNSGRTDNLAIIRNQWRDLLHKTMSAYTFLFDSLDELFLSIWDIDTDCFFEIV